MGFREIQALDADVTVALGKTDKKTGKAYPKQAEGYYLGSRTVENKRGEGKLHFLQTAKGNLGVWGTTDLNRKLQQVTIGVMTRITSTGTRPTPNGDMYTYCVETDPDNTTEVSPNLASDYGTNDDAGEEYESGNYETSKETGGGEEYETSAAEAERAAKVRELLNRGKATRTVKN